MSAISLIKSARPWQLLGLFLFAMGLGLWLFMTMPADLSRLPGPVAKLIQAHWRTWLVMWFAFLGLMIDMLVFYRSRPGGTTDAVERGRREQRRAVIMAAVTVAGAMSL